MGGESDDARARVERAECRIVAVGQLPRRRVERGVVVEAEFIQFCFGDLPCAGHIASMSLRAKRSNPLDTGDCFVAKNKSAPRNDIFIISLDTFRVRGVNSPYVKLKFDTQISRKERARMSTLISMTPFVPVDTGFVPSRSAPRDR